MNVYTVITREGHKRRRWPALARNWHQAWRDAIERFGLRVVISVAPFK